MQNGRLIIRHAILSFVSLLLFIALNHSSVLLISRLGSVTWYPATGFVLALCLGISPWYAVLICVIALIPGALFYHQPFLSFGQTVGDLGFAMCYGAAAYILRGPLRIDLGLRRRRDVVRYLFVSVIAAIAATVIGVSCLAGDKTIQWGDFWPSAWMWFAGDGIALLGVAPFFLVHVFPWVRKQISSAGRWEQQEKLWRKKSRVNPIIISEAAGQALALLATLWIMFGDRLASQQLFFLGFLPIIWIAMRQGIRRVVSGLLAFNFGIILAMHLFPPAEGVSSKVGLFMLVISGVGLIVGSSVSERHRISIDLLEQTAHLNSLIENSPFGIVVMDLQGRIELVNTEFEKLFLCNQKELAGRTLDSAFMADDFPPDFETSVRRVLGGETLHTTVRLRTKDGRYRDLDVHAIPLAVDGRVRGSYTIYKDISEQIRVSEAERKHAEVLNKLVAELQLRTRQMSLLSEMGDLLDVCGTTQEACAVVAQSMQKLLPEVVSGTLYLFRSSRNLVETAIQWGAPGFSEELFAPDACWSLRRSQPHWNQLAGGIDCAHLKEPAAGKCLCVPMVGHGDMLGVLHLEFAKEAMIPAEPGSESLEVTAQRWATTVAGQVALSLASLRLRETLRDQSIRDPLTGLFNRRFMEESLEREMQRAVRKNHPVSVLFVDLDHFKRFNDTFGHDAGDFVLRSIADLFRRLVRVDDVICRYGGEEFGIILPESSLENAVIRADALREAAKKMDMRYKNRSLGTVTLSVGVATFPEHGENSEDLLKTADQSLYKSKAGGRDQVTAAPRRIGDRETANKDSA
jgi:diguanylate cyclase (GGDEF)-like protein/PAS domain S-box-containing protein